MLRVIIAVVICLTSAAHAAPFSKELAPPRVFEGLRAGVALANANLADWRPDDAYRDAADRRRYTRDAGDGARYYVLVKDATISRIGIEAPKDGLVEKLTSLWGKPVRSTNAANESLATWSGASWRVDLSCRAAVCRLAFHRPLDAAYFGSAVAPPGDLATLKPWMTRTEIGTQLPRFASGEVPAGPEDVRLAVDLDRAGRLRSVLVAGLPDTARAVLEQAWGRRDADGMWWNPAGGWRAKLAEDLHALQLFPYVPAAALLGKGAGIAALRFPILGVSRAQVTQRYPVLALAPIEDGLGPTEVDVMYDQGGFAKQIQITLPFASTARRDAIVKLCEAKWGIATRTGQNWVFPSTKPRIELVEGVGALVLRLSR